MVVKAGLRLTVVLMTGLFMVASCSSQSSGGPSQKGRIPNQTMESLRKDIAERDERIKDLQNQLEQAGRDSDRLMMLKESSDLLYKAAKDCGNCFPILYDDGDPVKKAILGSVDFKSKLIDIKDNELIIGAGIGQITPDATKAVVEMSVFQQVDQLNDIEPVKVMFLHMVKENGQWKMTSFQRSN